MTVVTDEQFVSIHTADGVTMYQFSPEQYTDLTWTRRQRDASQCDITIPPTVDLDRLPTIIPWSHWVSVWDGVTDRLLWTGPVMKPVKNRRGLSVNAKDHAAYHQKTRVSITKRWDAADPSKPAGELWQSLIAAQGLKARPIVRVDPEGERFDYQVIADEQMMDQALGDLVQLGLRWSIVAGVPIIGPVGLDSVTSLSEDDFLGDGVNLVIDGAAIFNDVLVRGQGNEARARTSYYGQNLQTIVNLDHLSDVSNVAKAARQYVRQTGAARTRLDVPSGTELHPDAPVTIDDLMCSARFVIEAQGLRELMELTDVSVTRRSGGAGVSVTMKALPDRDTEGHLIELADVESKAQPVMTLGGQAGRG
ncbi:minor tail protein [Mycobacterium phage Indlovu]|nr:minor tail protein [Mycobacterium phage Indlovu]